MTEDSRDDSGKAIKKELVSIYTTIAEARKEISKRWDDVELRKRVEDYLGDDFPEIFRDGPKAVLFRFIATPNYECRQFLDAADIIGLDPVYMEFANDNFCTRNADKIYLGKIGIHQGSDRNGNSVINFKKIIDLEKNDNKPFSEITTFWGEKLIDFHREIFHLHMGKKVKRMDVASLNGAEGDPLDTYKKLFPLFLCYGVFFENYFLKGNGYEKRFFSEVIKPAFDITSEKFGVRPLIVPILGMLDKSEQEELFWQYYPKDLIKIIEQKNNYGIQSN